MPFIFRGDEPGAWAHVCNRGIARRSICESARDARVFLALLALAVRRGTIEVHAYCLMTTHFHLLLRSPVGRLSESMQRIEGPYSRWFNRSRRRDGPLFRGRFRGSLIQTPTYRQAVLAYIDRNPVEARVVEFPSQYPYGSASMHIRPRGPRWLSRDVVAGILGDRGGAVGCGAANYDPAVLGLVSAASGELVERRLIETPHEPTDDDWPDDPLEDLVHSAPPRVQAWMFEKARLADATAPGAPVLGPTTLLQVLAAKEPALRGMPLAKRVLPAGLLRGACGLQYAEIGARVGCSWSAAHRRVVAHLAALRTDGAYAELAAEVLSSAFAVEFPGAAQTRLLLAETPALWSASDALV